MISRFLKRGTALFRQSFVYTLVVFTITAIPTVTVAADEVDELKAMIEQMEVRHQQEMAALRKQIEALSKTQKQQSSENEKIADLEDEVDSLYEAQAEVKKEDDRFRWTAFTTAEFSDLNGKDSALSGVGEIIAYQRLTDRLTGTFQIEIEGETGEAGETGETEVEIEQAWLEYNFSEAFKPAFGVILMPFGTFNKNHFDAKRELVSFPIASTVINPAVWKEAAMGFSGRKNVAGKAAVNYEAYFVNGISDRFTDNPNEEFGGGTFSDNNDDKSLIGRLGIEPFNNLEIGFSGYHGRYNEDAGSADLTGYAGDIAFRWKALELKGEYYYFDLDNGLVEQVDDAGIETQVAAPAEAYGYYAQANYRFWPTFLNNSFLKKQFPDSVITASMRYGMAHIDDDGDDDNGDGNTIDPDNEETRLTLGLNYRPVSEWVYKLEYQFNDTENEELVHGERNGFFFAVSSNF